MAMNIPLRAWGAWVPAILFSILAAGAAQAEEFRALQIEEGTFRTNLAGEPNFRPPFVQVIRTQEGLDYVLAQYERMKDRYIAERMNQLKRQFGKINFNENMLIAVLSQPLDRFSMRYLGMDKSKGAGPITVRVSYYFDGRMTGKSGQKTVYFIFLVTPKTGQPVLLEAKSEGSPQKAENKPPQRVTGQLMEYGNGKAQLVVETRGRGKKSAYYIKNVDLEMLRPYFGKRVTIEGIVKPEGLSAYEREISFIKIVKTLRPGEKAEEPVEEEAGEDPLPPVTP